jgi:ribosome-binding factor A
VPREFPRSRRVEEQIQRILSEALRATVRDPRVRAVMITAVKVSRDLSVAKVFYSTLGAEGVAAEERAAGLAAANSFLRTVLARELRVRQVPELRFLPDESFERGVALERLITEAAAGSPAVSAPLPDATSVADPGAHRAPDKAR